ncbi:MAG: hypothetical protein HQM16_15050 [Deltaproteobacteria bacterium]|nr:hypothetical protein [Deltaproteobacteria bacterium]
MQPIWPGFGVSRRSLSFNHPADANMFLSNCGGVQALIGLGIFVAGAFCTFAEIEGTAPAGLRNVLMVGGGWMAGIGMIRSAWHARNTLGIIPKKLIHWVEKNVLPEDKNDTPACFLEFLGSTKLRDPLDPRITLKKRLATFSYTPEAIKKLFLEAFDKTDVSSSGGKYYPALGVYLLCMHMLGVRDDVLINAVKGVLSDKPALRDAVSLTCSSFNRANITPLFPTFISENENRWCPEFAKRMKGLLA